MKVTSPTMSPIPRMSPRMSTQDYQKLKEKHPEFFTKKLHQFHYERIQDEYPEFFFRRMSPQEYQEIKEKNPEFFEMIERINKEHVKRWETMPVRYNFKLGKHEVAHRPESWRPKKPVDLELWAMIYDKPIGERIAIITGHLNPTEIIKRPDMDMWKFYWHDLVRKLYVYPVNTLRSFIETYYWEIFTWPVMRPVSLITDNIAGLTVNYFKGKNAGFDEESLRRSKYLSMKLICKQELTEEDYNIYPYFSGKDADKLEAVIRQYDAFLELERMQKEENIQLDEKLVRDIIGYYGENKESIENLNKVMDELYQNNNYDPAKELSMYDTIISSVETVYSSIIRPIVVVPTREEAKETYLDSSTHLSLYRRLTLLLRNVELREDKEKKIHASKNFVDVIREKVKEFKINEPHAYMNYINNNNENKEEEKKAYASINFIDAIQKKVKEAKINKPYTDMDYLKDAYMEYMKNDDDMSDLSYMSDNNDGYVTDDNDGYMSDNSNDDDTIYGNLTDYFTQNDNNNSGGPSDTHSVPSGPRSVLGLDGEEEITRMMLGRYIPGGTSNAFNTESTGLYPFINLGDYYSLYNYFLVKNSGIGNLTYRTNSTNHYLDKMLSYTTNYNSSFYDGGRFNNNWENFFHNQKFLNKSYYHNFLNPLYNFISENSYYRSRITNRASPLTNAAQMLKARSNFMMANYSAGPTTNYPTIRFNLNVGNINREKAFNMPHLGHKKLLTNIRSIKLKEYFLEQSLKHFHHIETRKPKPRIDLGDSNLLFYELLNYYKNLSYSDPLDKVRTYDHKMFHKRKDYTNMPEYISRASDRLYKKFSISDKKIYSDNNNVFIDYLSSLRQYLNSSKDNNISFSNLNYLLDQYINQMSISKRNSFMKNYFFRKHFLRDLYHRFNFTNSSQSSGSHTIKSYIMSRNKYHHVGNGYTTSISNNVADYSYVKLSSYDLISRLKLELVSKLSMNPRDVSRYTDIINPTKIDFFIQDYLGAQDFLVYLLSLITLIGASTYHFYSSIETIVMGLANDSYIYPWMNPSVKNVYSIWYGSKYFHLDFRSFESLMSNTTIQYGEYGMYSPPENEPVSLSSGWSYIKDHYQLLDKLDRNVHFSKEAFTPNKYFQDQSSYHVFQNRSVLKLPSFPQYNDSLVFFQWDNMPMLDILNNRFSNNLYNEYVMFTHNIIKYDISHLMLLLYKDLYFNFFVLGDTSPVDYVYYSFIEVISSIMIIIYGTMKLVFSLLNPWFFTMSLKFSMFYSISFIEYINNDLTALNLKHIFLNVPIWWIQDIVTALMHGAYSQMRTIWTDLGDNYRELAELHRLFDIWYYYYYLDNYIRTYYLQDVYAYYSDLKDNSDSLGVYLFSAYCIYVYHLVLTPAFYLIRLFLVSLLIESFGITIILIIFTYWLMVRWNWIKRQSWVFKNFNVSDIRKWMLKYHILHESYSDLFLTNTEILSPYKFRKYSNLYQLSRNSLAQVRKPSTEIYRRPHIGTHGVRTPLWKKKYYSKPDLVSYLYNDHSFNSSNKTSSKQSIKQEFYKYVFMSDKYFKVKHEMNSGLSKLPLFGSYPDQVYPFHRKGLYLSYDNFKNSGLFKNNEDYLIPFILMGKHYMDKNFNDCEIAHGSMLKSEYDLGVGHRNNTMSLRYFLMRKYFPFYNRHFFNYTNAHGLSKVHHAGRDRRIKIEKPDGKKTIDSVIDGIEYDDPAEHDVAVKYMLWDGGSHSMFLLPGLTNVNDPDIEDYFSMGNQEYIVDSFDEVDVNGAWFTDDVANLNDAQDEFLGENPTEADIVSSGLMYPHHLLIGAHNLIHMIDRQRRVVYMMTNYTPDVYGTFKYIRFRRKKNKAKRYGYDLRTYSTEFMTRLFGFYDYIYGDKGVSSEAVGYEMLKSDLPYFNYNDSFKIDEETKNYYIHERAAGQRDIKDLFFDERATLLYKYHVSEKEATEDYLSTHFRKVLRGLKNLKSLKKLRTRGSKNNVVKKLTRYYRPYLNKLESVLRHYKETGDLINPNRPIMSKRVFRKKVQKRLKNCRAKKVVKIRKPIETIYKRPYSYKSGVQGEFLKMPSNRTYSFFNLDSKSFKTGLLWYTGFLRKKTQLDAYKHWYRDFDLGDSPYPSELTLLQMNNLFPNFYYNLIGRSYDFSAAWAHHVKKHTSFNGLRDKYSSFYMRHTWEFDASTSLFFDEDNIDLSHRSVIKSVYKDGIIGSSAFRGIPLPRGMHEADNFDRILHDRTKRGPVRKRERWIRKKITDFDQLGPRDTFWNKLWGGKRFRYNNFKLGLEGFLKRRRMARNFRRIEKIHYNLDRFKHKYYKNYHFFIDSCIIGIVDYRTDEPPYQMDPFWAKFMHFTGVKRYRNEFKKDHFSETRFEEDYQEVITMEKQIGQIESTDMFANIGMFSSFFDVFGDLSSSIYYSWLIQNSYERQNMDTYDYTQSYKKNNALGSLELENETDYDIHSSDSENLIDSDTFTRKEFDMYPSYSKMPTRLRHEGEKYAFYPPIDLSKNMDTKFHPKALKLKRPLTAIYKNLDSRWRVRRARRRKPSTAKVEGMGPWLFRFIKKKFFTLKPKKRRRLTKVELKKERKRKLKERKERSRFPFYTRKFIKKI